MIIEEKVYVSVGINNQGHAKWQLKRDVKLFLLYMTNRALVEWIIWIKANLFDSMTLKLIFKCFSELIFKYVKLS